MSSAFIVARRPSIAREGPQLVVGEKTVALLRAVEHARHSLLRRLEAVALEPEDDVRLAGHRSDLDALLAADDGRWHAAVHRVGETAVTLAKRLDHRRRVHARAGAEGIRPERRVVRRYRDPAVLGHERDVFDEWREVAVDEAPEAHVHEQLVHRGVADALADAERGSVYTVGDGSRGERVDRAEAPIVVTVVIERDIPSADDLIAQEREEVAHSLGR